MRLGPERPLPFASFEIESVSGMRELSKLSAGQNKLYEKVQEEVSLGFVLDGACVCKSGIEEVSDLAGEYFRAVILADEAVVFCLYEKSGKILDFELHGAVGDQGLADDDRPECDVV